MQLSCDDAPGGEALLSGHWLETPCAHHEPAGHGLHVGPAYPSLQIHWQVVEDVRNDACGGAPVQPWHTRSAVLWQGEIWYDPEVQMVQGAHAETDVCSMYEENVLAGHVVGVVEFCTQ